LDLQSRRPASPHSARGRFSDFDKDGHPLVPVSATERMGLVFVTQDEPALGGDPLGA
jgi:hypothetical protein